MARLVIHEEQHPAKVTVGNETKSICMCGLSKNKPFCDGSHHQTQTEIPGKLYVYQDGKRIELSTK